jgi:hypothetical protein
MKYPVWAWPTFAVIAGVLGMSALWTIVAVGAGKPCGWLALIAAADIAVMLRVGRWPPGLGRASIAALATALTIGLSQWLVVAANLGFAFGLQPLTSALRLGPVLAWELTRLNFQRIDWILAGLSLPFAAGLTWERKKTNR